MEQRIRDSFHLIWLMAVVLCAAVAVFALFFGSCAKGGAAPADSGVRQDVPADNDGWHDVPVNSDGWYDVPAPAEIPDTAAPPDMTYIPADTPEPTEAPPEETPVPEPQG